MGIKGSMASKGTRASIVAVCNHKGGVGKTTTTANLGAALAEKKKRCLLVDLDPQSNLTQSLGVDSPEATVYDILTEDVNPTPINLKNNLDLIPSSLDLSGAELELANEAGREMILKESLGPIVKSYDFILLDCPPSLGLLTLNALVACDCVIIPLQTQFLAIQGLTKLDKVIGKVKKRLNKKIELGGVLFTQYDGRKILDRQVVESVKKSFKERIFKTRIRGNVALAEAPSKGHDIFEYSTESHGAEDYRAFCKEFLRGT